MRETVIKKASSPLVAAIGMILLLIFIGAMKHPRQKNTYSYLALGDSYTIGEKVKAEENFPNQTVAMLHEKGLDFKKPVIVAKTGWTTDELQEGIRKTNLERHYDFVTLLIGVNNQYRQQLVAGYHEQFEALLKKALRYTRHDPRRVIVLSIPDWGVTPFAEGRNSQEIAVAIDEYNATNKRISDKYHVHYINITPGTRKAANDKELIAEDGLHPSGKEYRVWAEELAKIIAAEL
jgi:lysophospholipase L1-like esterase